MRKTALLITAIVLLTTLIGAKSLAKQNSTIPEEVLAVAKEFTTSGLEHEPTKWGFSHATEVKRLTLGEGFRVNYIGAIDLGNVSGDSLLELINPNIIETWLFTLDLDGEPRIFLTVALEKGEYRVVGYGGNAELFAATRASFDAQMQAKGVIIEPVLLKSGPTYFFTAKIGDEEFALPVGGIGDNYSTTDSGQLLPASEVVEYLRHLQDNSVPDQRGGIAPREISPSSNIGKKLGHGRFLAAAGMVSAAHLHCSA